MSVTATKPISIPIEHREVPPEVSPSSSVILSIALKIIREMALTFAFGVIVSCFLPIEAGLAILAEAALIQLIVGCFFHSIGGYAACQTGTGWEKITSICQWVTGVNFGYLAGFNGRSLIHEGGHALAILTVYENPNPQIGLNPFREGFTQYHKTALSPFGKAIGPVKSTFLVAVSGPLFALALSSVILAIGIHLRENNPHLSKYLISWSLLDFLYHVFYAYEALFVTTTTLRHDFAHLSIFGIHPIAAMIAIIAIPTMVTLGTLYLESRTQTSS